MSNQLGTSRATRTNKDRHAKSTVMTSQATTSPTSKSEKPNPKNQATMEQMRMAQMIDSGKDVIANIDTVKQLCEMTGRSEDDVIVALHDAQDDPDRAVAILIDGEQGQGEWEVQDKKKKRSTAKSEKDMAGSSPQDNDRGDQRADRSRDRHDSDKHDGPPSRRGRDRRNGGPPPRLANRGRGRERNNYRGDRDRDRGGFGGRGQFADQNDRNAYNENNTVNGEEDWDAEILAESLREQQHSAQDYRDQKRGDRDRGGFDRDRSFGADRERGGFGDRDRSFGGDRERGGFGADRDRGFAGDRGRSFGGQRGRGRGRGGFGVPPRTRGGRPRRTDRNDSSEGPHIDTWTNETAENAEKENSAWGETWADSTEDWCEDQWTGSLEDTKVFTSSQTKTSVETDLTANISEPSSTLGQRLDVGSLFSKSAEFAKAPDFTKTGEPTSGDSFFASYNQQAAESIKNSIGIGSSSGRQTLSSLPSSVPQSLGSLPAMPQRDLSHSQGAASQRSSVPTPLLPQPTSAPPAMHAQSTSSVAPPLLSAPTSATGPSAPASTPPLAQPTQPQQRRQQRSKLPPPSKIPASAVEMPGHPLPQLDVQFGVEFGAESSQFGYAPPANTSTYSASSSATSASNHLGESSKVAADSGRQGAIMSSPPSGSQPSQNAMPSMEPSQSRPPVFPDSVYSSPTKSESPANKVAEPTAFPSPAAEHKPPSLMAAQRPPQSSATLSQGSMASSKSERDSSNMPNFSVANGYAANSYPSHSQSHKPSSSSSPSQSYRQSGSVSQTSGTSYPGQFPSQSQYSGAGGAQQSQFASGQPQFPGAQGAPFPSAGGSGGGGGGGSGGGSSSAGQAASQYLGAQSQYPGGGSQGSSFPAAPVSQGQFQAGGGQFHSNYQSSAVSFQSQPAVQPSQNPLYPSTTQQQSGAGGGSSYPPGSGSYHVRDSQSSGSLPQSVVGLQQGSGAGSLPPSVVSLQGSSGSLQQSMPPPPPNAAPATCQAGSSSYQGQQQPAPGLSKATTTVQSGAGGGGGGSAYSAQQTYNAGGGAAGAPPSQPPPPHGQPTSTQSPSSFSSQSFSSQHAALHSQASTTQSGASFSSQGAYATQHGPATSTQTTPSAYNTQTFSAQHNTQQSLQNSPMANKLGDSLSKMTMKDSPTIESRTSQYDHANNSTTTASLTSSSSSTTTNASSISTSTSTVSATSTPVVTTSTLASRVTTSIPLTTKAPPNLPPGVPLMNPHVFMGQAASGLPPYFAGLQGLQQPLYGYEELQMMQPARLPLQQAAGNFYDLTAYSGVPSTIAAGRDQAALGTAPFTGAATDNKQMNRMEAQSPSQSSQQQSTHSAPQQTLPFNIHYSYFYPGAMLPGTAGFQYPTMFPMPPVTNTAAAHVPGTTTAAQLPKTYGSHQGFPSKGTGTTADMNTGGYPKTHAQQGFEKQGFPGGVGGTPPPFNMSLANASQAGPLGAPATPYGTPFLPMMPPQPHNQTLLHHPMPQESNTGSNRGLQQPTNQGKPAPAKNNYYSNWN